MTPKLVARIRAVGAIPVRFAGYVNFPGDVMDFYGDERFKRMFAYRSFIDAGLRPPTSSDYTASPPPMLWLYSMTTRRDPTEPVWGEAQRIALTEAVRSAPPRRCVCVFRGARQGRIEPGKLADLVVPKEDIFTAPAHHWLDIKVERSMLGGQWVYES